MHWRNCKSLILTFWTIKSQSEYQKMPDILELLEFVKMQFSKKIFWRRDLPNQNMHCACLLSTSYAYMQISGRWQCLGNCRVSVFCSFAVCLFMQVTTAEAGLELIYELLRASQTSCQIELTLPTLSPITS